jgi:hypothetical protein
MIKIFKNLFQVVVSWCAHFTLTLYGWKSMHFFSACDIHAFLDSKKSSDKTNEKLLIVCKKTSSWDDFFIKCYMYDQGIFNFCLIDEKIIDNPGYMLNQPNRLFIFSSYKTFLWEYAAQIIRPLYIVGGGVNYHPKVRTFHLGDLSKKWINTNCLDLHESRVKLKSMLATVYPLYDESSEPLFDSKDDTIVTQYQRLLAPRCSRIQLVNDESNLSYAQVKDVRAIDLIILSLFTWIVPIISFKMTRNYDMCLACFWAFYKQYLFHISYEDNEDKYPSTNQIRYLYAYLSLRMLVTSFIESEYMFVLTFSLCYLIALMMLGGNRKTTEYRSKNYVMCRSLFYCLFSSIMYVWSSIDKIY